MMKTISDGMAQLVATSGQSIVRVEGRKRLSATGVVWSADGVIVTAHHVVQRDENIRVGLPDGNSVEATVVGRDPGVDLAILRVSASDLTPAQWLGENELAVGHLVLALGRPGKTVQATLGIVSAIGGEWRTHAGGTIEQYLQTDVVMYPGFSGGPLVSVDGRFAGMNTSGLTRGTSVAVPGQTLKRTVDAILTHGHVPHGYLGIGVQPVRLADNLQQSVNQETGLMIMSVEADGPAAKGGLVQGDVITQINGVQLSQVDELQAFLRGDCAGKTVPVQLLRGGAAQELQVTVGTSHS